jgi:hypothetical protein
MLLQFACTRRCASHVHANCLISAAAFGRPRGVRDCKGDAKANETAAMGSLSQRG